MISRSHSSFFILHSSFNYQHLIILKCLISTYDNLLPRLQAFEHLVILWILPAYADVAAVCLVAVAVENEDPVAASDGIECTFGYQHRLLGFAKLEVDVVGLASADILRTLAVESEINLEASLFYFGIYLPHS